MDNTLKERMESANLLNKARKYSDAIAVYEEVLQKDDSAFSGWDARCYVNSLRKSGKPSSAIAFARSWLAKNASNQHVLNELAWSLYDQYLKGDTGKEAQLVESGKEILKICKPDDMFAPSRQAIFKIVKYYMKLAIPRYEKALEWLEQLDVKQLSDQETQSIDKDGKTKPGASDLEKYYAAKTSILLNLERYSECRQYIDLAQQRISVFHDNQDIWMERKKAKCLVKMGRIEDAEKIMTKVLLRKREWYIFHEMAEIAFAQGNATKAIRYAIDGALAYAEPERKIHLFELMAEILRARGDETTAKLHMELVAAIRKEKAWSISQVLHESLKSYGIEMQAIESSVTILRKLKSIWESLKFVDQSMNSGKIRTILEHGKSGFIETTDNKSYFFRLASVVGSPKLAKPGTAVTFFLEEGFDAKKGKASLNAVNVKISQ